MQLEKFNPQKTNCLKPSAVIEEINIYQKL